MSELQRMAIREAMRLLEDARNGFREACMPRVEHGNERLAMCVEAGVVQSKARLWLEAALEADDEE